MAPMLSSPARGPESNQVPGSSVIPIHAWLCLREAMRLSDRELQIIQAVFDDREFELLARDLVITTEVAYRAMQKIYVKLQIGSRAELIVRVMSEYLAFVADHEEPETSGLSYWPLVSKRRPPEPQRGRTTHAA